ncbi:hypothetical protein A3B01_00845 [Candidatus Nomurabacteria bacterium RIFCSPLOWO2_01_FULL_41_52b]|nr:MAG: hypothetical protein A3B01_00845 [Candidatus Nomurabacteria bacterium RIFCSPLOWO2_01_FULL_41_52b]
MALEGKKLPHVKSEVATEKLFYQRVWEMMSKNPSLANMKMRYKIGESVLINSKLPIRVIVKKAEAGLYLVHTEEVKEEKERRALIANEDMLLPFN